MGELGVSPQELAGKRGERLSGPGLICGPSAPGKLAGAASPKATTCRGIIENFLILVSQRSFLQEGAAAAAI